MKCFHHIQCFECLTVLILCFWLSEEQLEQIQYEKLSTSINVIDLTQAAHFGVVSEFYAAVKEQKKVCVRCGVPSFGTALHLEYESSYPTAMYPTRIPTEYLLTRLLIIDVSNVSSPTFVLNKEMALEWDTLKHDPKEPTLLLFKFGWDFTPKAGKVWDNCACKVPGIGFDLAEYIVENLTHVVGVATDAPTLESEESRMFNIHNVARVLGKNGIYVIENVKLSKGLPENSCLTLAAPQKLLHTTYVPCRLFAFCPGKRLHQEVIITLRNPYKQNKKVYTSPYRNDDLALADLLLYGPRPEFLSV